MAVKATKYQGIISKSKEVKDSEAIENSVEEARIQMDADILEAKRKMVGATKYVESTIARTPFNSANVVNAQEDAEVAKAHYQALVDLKADLF